eukprot:gene9963-20718_t
MEQILFSYSLAASLQTGQQLNLQENSITSTQNNIICDIFHSTNIGRITNTWDSCSTTTTTTIKPYKPICDGSESSWMGIICDQGDVVIINLPNKGLIGYIPSSLGYLNTLQFLSLHSNSLRGSIPSSIALSSSLFTLELHSNSLTGTVPSNLCDSNIGRMTLYNNNDISCYDDCMRSDVVKDFGTIPLCNNVAITPATATTTGISSQKSPLDFDLGILAGILTGLTCIIVIIIVICKYYHQRQQASYTTARVPLLVPIPAPAPIIPPITAMNDQMSIESPPVALTDDIPLAQPISPSDAALLEVALAVVYQHEECNSSFNV